MQCPQCQADNRSQRRFCAQCGAALILECSSCKFVNEPGEKFCGGCGTPLGDGTAAAGTKFSSPELYTPKHLADKILKSKTALEGERKQVTILFCDITQSTVLAERLGPEGMHAILNRFFELALAEIHRYEGTINQFLGDGFMALFGAPIAHEDHARRAVLAALDIQKAMADFGADRAATLQVRIGLNTGPVVIGAIGDNLRMDYTAVGDTTHLAARLQAAAAPGQIVISQATHNIVDGYCSTRPLAMMTPKGISEPVETWEVVDDKGARTRLEVAAERGLTPFVGRERELRVLQESFDRAAAGKGQMVFIVGDPGIGKSRLLYEFRRKLGPRAAWNEGHSVSFGWSMAFHPLIDLLRRSFRIEETDSEKVIIVKIERGIMRLGEDPQSVGPYLRYLLAVDPGDPTVQTMEPQLRRAEIFDSLRRVMLRAAEERPQVVVFEDLHWMDQATEFYLRFVTDSIPAGRILFILTYRPGYINPIAERTFQSRIALGTLSSDDSVKMAGSILDAASLPHELQKLIVRKAEGNPFFVEEVMKSLAEVGALKRSGDSFVLTGSPAEILIPDTIQDVIMARIDRLPEAPKRTLQLASVIGRKFTYRLLDRLEEIRGKTETYLNELKALELIYEKDIFPELAFMFKHALTQDVAYNSLLARRRCELHRIIGLAMEELYSDRLHEHFEVLAHHFEKGEDRTRALNYLLKAGAKAAQSFANREALAFYDQAFDLATHPGSPPEPDILMEIHQARADLFFVLSDFSRSLEEGRRALALARRIGDRVKEGDILVSLGYTSLWSHDFEGAFDYARQALEVAGGTDVEAVSAGGNFVIGLGEALTGRIDSGMQKIERALVFSQAAGDAFYESLSLGFIGHFKNWRGEYADALPYLAQGLQIAEKHLLPAPYLDSLFMYGITLTGHGDYDRAAKIFNDGLTFAEKVGDEVYYLRIMNSLGWLYLECGDLDRAVDVNRRAARGARRRGDPETIANSELNLADALMARGDLAAAGEILDGIDRLARLPSTSDWMKWRYTTHLFASRGELRLAQGDPGRAEEFARRCLQTATATNSRKYMVKGWRLKAATALSHRRPEEAESAMHQALSLAEHINNPTQLWKTHLAAGDFYTETGRQEQARAAYRSARDVVDRVKANLADEKLRNSLESSSLIRRIYSGS